MPQKQPARHTPRGDAPVEGMGDRLELRVFTLADHAATPPDGKLYINGAGVEQMFLQQIPGALGPLWLAIRVRVPWNMTSEQMSLTIRALDADRNPVGPDPLAQANLEVGRPPGLRPGDEIGLNLAVPVTGFPVQGEGTIYFHLLVAERTLGVLPLKVRRLPTPQLAPGP